MDLNITHLANDVESLIDFSASVAEGYTGRETWQNALDYFDDYENLVSTESDVQEVKDDLAEFGAWSRDEINEWNVQEVNALLLQFIAGDLRERQHYIDEGELDDYEERLGGRIYTDDDEQTWFYVGL